MGHKSPSDWVSGFQTGFWRFPRLRNRRKLNCKITDASKRLPLEQDGRYEVQCAVDGEHQIYFRNHDKRERRCTKPPEQSGSPSLMIMSYGQVDCPSWPVSCNDESIGIIWVVWCLLSTNLPNTNVSQPMFLGYSSL